MKLHSFLILPIVILTLISCQQQSPTEEESTIIQLEIEQITHGPQNHFFGYIGHVQNIPWNGSDRYILSLRIDFIDRMPNAKDVADIVLIDTDNDYSVQKIAETRAWNPQQGTMMYWNPEAPDTQFFFNDRDSVTNHIFCVLFDIEQNKRIKEFRYEDTPFGNGGINQKGGTFAGINYGRMARLRKVTGYPEAYDWNPEALHPENDGVFLVDIASGEKKLLVSFRQMRDALFEKYPRIDTIPLFINHTLWNRDGDRLFFFVRGRFGSKGIRINVPMTIRADGSGLIEQEVFIGGHPEWELGVNMIGTVSYNTTDASNAERKEERLVLYDSETQQVIEELGSNEIFPDPGNDVALSPDAKWLVQGFEEDTRTAYSVFRRSDGVWAHTPWYDQRLYYKGDLRIDASPKWNRASNQVLFPSLVEGEVQTRQLFLINIRKK